jgi:hypothetical protein
LLGTLDGYAVEELTTAQAAHLLGTKVHAQVPTRQALDVFALVVASMC